MSVPVIQNKSAEAILSQVFGFKSFRPLQRSIIDSVMNGENNFVLMPTGGGKSICYQIPAIMQSGVGIVISPLISLMQDQVASLQANGVSCAFYNSSLSYEASQAVLNKLRHNELDLLYVAPERLLRESFLEHLRTIDIALIAIDEAHCVSQWGADFRPEYAKLGCLREHFPQVPVIALTATADKQTRQDVIEKLKLHNANTHIASFNRPNISYEIIEKYQPLQQLKVFLEQYSKESGIVYCLSRKKVEEVAIHLQNEGYSAKAYHAGFDNVTRSNVLKTFMADDVKIVVATVAFGMGIDKSNVRFVVHFDLPKTIEAYYQETGRAGRDGLPAKALLLYGVGDIAKTKMLIEQSNNEVQKRIERHKLSIMGQFAEATSCRRRVLLNYFGEEQPEDCGNCDICLNPPEQYDATVDAQKALSGVYRVQQRFGVMHVVDVLRGSQSKRVIQFGHDRLSTYGLFANKSSQECYSLFRQLIHHGYIEQDIQNYSILKLTPKAKEILRGDVVLMLAKERVKLKKSQPEKRAKRDTKTNAKETYDYDKTLFEKLRVLRKQLATKDHVPPFIIFSDASLVEMSYRKPTSKDEFLCINGVGQKKLESYGDDFLREISDYTSEISYEND